MRCKTRDLSRAKLGLTLCLGLLAAQAQALPRFDPFPAPRQGELFIVRILSAQPITSMEISLRLSDGSVIGPENGASRVLVSGSYAALGFLPLPMQAPLGNASIFIKVNEGGKPVFLGRSLNIEKRDYSQMDIALTPSLSDMRSKPDPRKDEESRILTALLYKKNKGADFLDAPFIRPIQEKAVTATFGDRRRYLYASGGTATSIHTGVDLHADTGLEIQAAGPGRVVMARNRIITGKTVVIEHQSGLYSLYYHLHTLATLEGQILKRGQIIGTVGSTGLSTGPHLHWELRLNAEALDPEGLIDHPLLDKIVPITTIEGSYEGR